MNARVLYFLSFSGKRMRSNLTIIPLLLICVFASSCKKKSGTDPRSQTREKPIPPDFPKPDVSISPPESFNNGPAGISAFATLGQGLLAHWKQEREDRHELVWPAPKDFSPSRSDHKLELRLKVRDTMLRRGKNLWYRAELHNSGSDEVRFNDQTAFFRQAGSIVRTSEGSQFRFKILDPEGKEVQILLPLPIRCPHKRDSRPAGWDEMDPQEKMKALTRMKMDAESKSRLRVRLRPGETLVTRANRFLSSKDRCELRQRGKEPDARIAGDYRELWLGDWAPRPGAYTIRLIYSDPTPAPLTEDEIDERIALGHSRETVLKNHEELVGSSLGIIRSNPVTVEIAP